MEDIAIIINTGDYLVYDDLSGQWVPSSYQQHPDFQPNGKLYDNDQIRKYFPSDKKESFFNYVKLFHNDRLSELLVHYSSQILEQPWPEAEEYINDYWKEEYNEVWSKGWEV